MKTLTDFLFDKVARFPDRSAFTFWQNEKWLTRSWREFAGDVARTVQFLEQRGVAAGDRVVLVSSNRYAWPVADLAIQAVGAVSVPLNPLLTVAQSTLLLQHAQPRMILVGGGDQLKKMHKSLPNLQDEISPGIHEFDSDLDFIGDEGCLADETSLLALQNLAEKNVHAASLVTVLYTSGTAGNPKGVMLTQSNLVSNALAKVATLPLDVDDLRVCWLPMVHIFARLADLMTGWLTGCHTVISRGRDFLMEELQNFSPTYINGVPWLYEKLYWQLVATGNAERPGALKALLGNQIRICNCGGAPLPGHVLECFSGQGVTLINGYGLTEASPVVSSNSPAHNRPGSVGRAVPGVEIRIGSGGAIQVRGPNVMAGYFRDPETTRAVIRDGWLDTGDLGQVDGEGFLWITGRASEMIVTSTGRNISPVQMENRLMADPLIRQCVVAGDNRPCLVALVVVDPTQISESSRPGQAPPEEEWLKSEILQRCRDALADFAPYEQIAGVVLVSHPFSVEDGTATPKQSLRRQEILRRYASEIDDAYQQIAQTRRMADNPAQISNAPNQKPRRKEI